MEREIQQVAFPPIPKKRKRVAAYARVSSGKDAMLHSLSAQISYYSDMIQKHLGWEFAGVFADEAKTGTRDGRENFQKLLQACREKQVDMIITKSISRFARNTVTLLATVRELKALGVDVFFEEQNIHTLSADGELMISVLASYAQEESLSASENQKWRIRKNFEAGMPWGGALLGYRLKDGQYVIEPSEAETVRYIFREYLAGRGTDAIVSDLNAMGVPTRYGGSWNRIGVSRILRNYTYTGNLLLQKTFCEDHLTKKDVLNQGQRPQYHVENAHEAIISLDDFNAVQAEIQHRAEKHCEPGRKREMYPYSGLITCGCCGARYSRKVTHGGPVWICRTYNSQGKVACPSKAIPERVLDSLTADISLGDLTALRAENGNRLVFCLRDGSKSVKCWEDRSRAESWTPEMKEAARQKSKMARSKAVH